MYNNLTISVVMATYNGAKFIKEQLDSIVNQTLIPDELLISDDGSSDSTLEIVSEYMKRYSFIRLRMNNDNHGPSGNFINAFYASKGDIIFPCDQDDVWMLNKLERIILRFSSSVDIVAAQDEIVNDETEEVSFSNWGFPILAQTMWKNYLAGHACAFRRSVLTIYEDNKLLSFDYMLCLYGSISQRFIVIPDTLVKWRRHEDTVSHSDLLIDFKAPKTKYGKLFYAIQQCHDGNRSQSFNEFMRARESVIKRMGGGKVECELLRLISKQNAIGFIVAGLYNVILQKKIFHSPNIKKQIAHAFWSFCYPAVYWTEVRKEKYIT